MIINLIKSKQMFSLTLPHKVKGQYWVTDIDDNGKSRSATVSTLLSSKIFICRTSLNAVRVRL